MTGYNAAPKWLSLTMRNNPYEIHWAKEEHWAENSTPPPGHLVNPFLLADAARQPCHRRLDWLLQQPPTPPGAGDEDPR